MTYIKINDVLFPATITGQNADKEWDNRESKSIRLEANYEMAKALFDDTTAWSIVMEETVDVTPQFVVDEEGNIVYELIDVTPRFEKDPETGELLLDEENNPIPYTGEQIYEQGGPIVYNGDPIYEKRLVEYDNSEYNVRGDILVHVDGTCTVKMGKPTELETARMEAVIRDAEITEIASKNEELQTALDILLGGNV